MSNILIRIYGGLETNILYDVIEWDFLLETRLRTASAGLHVACIKTILCALRPSRVLIPGHLVSR